MTGTGPGGRIVVGVDGSASSAAALLWAVRQADLTGARVLAISAWSVPVTYGPIPVPQLWTDWSGIARRSLSDAVRTALGERAPEVEVDAVEGGAAFVLLEAARDAELIVVGSRGRGGFAGLLLGSVALTVTTHARCPVVVVHDRRYR
ncbi:MAG: universal stress protein [Pseudonocardia sp.]|nr:universal stress protein [Pseudonocardia sp.]